jgi:ribulose-phosphate 3-epimerase
MVSFHAEAVWDPAPVIDKARGLGMGVGITMNMETPVDSVFPYFDALDDVMLMSIPPGWSGQPLDPAVFPRLEAVRSEIDRRGLSAEVEIDGGVKLDNAQQAIDAGATVLVAASGVFRESDPAAAATALAAIAEGAR